MVRRSVVLLGLFVLQLGAPAAADVTWKVADEGPRAPDVGLILGDDSRTLAFSDTNTFEFDGANWRPVTLNSTAGDQPRLSFFAGGRFVATSVQNGQLNFYVLRGNDWVALAAFPSTYSRWLHTDERIYVPAPSFNLCIPSQPCPPNEADARNLLSISLVDGSIREEPPLPACYGRLFTLSGHLYLIQEPPGCGGPSSRAAGRAPNASLAWPFFRLDGDQWTSLPPWDLPTDTLVSTPNSLWVVYPISLSSEVARIFTASGLSDPIPFTRINPLYQPVVLEWEGRYLVTGEESSGNIYELQSGSLVKLMPESPVSAAPETPRVFVAGSRLFTAADGWDPFLFSSSGWTLTSGITGPPGASSYAMGDTKTFALRGTRVFRRDEAGWTPLPPVPGSPWVWNMAVWQDRPILLVSATFVDVFRLVAHDPVSNLWEDLKAPSGFVEPMLVSGEDLYVCGLPGQVARLRDGSWTIVAASVPPGPTEEGAFRIREANGSIYLIASQDYYHSIVYRVSEDELAPVFTDRDPRMNVDDIAAVGEQIYLLVGDGSRQDELEAAIVTPVTGGYQTLVTDEDFKWSDVTVGDQITSLGAIGQELLFGGLTFQGGQVRAQRGAILPTSIDPSGRFASGDRFTPAGPGGRGPLFVPISRVRKNLAVVADTTGVGGVHYRSELTIANFSASSRALARVFSGAGTTPVLEVPLPPGVQATIEDPVPGIVGPAAVEFEGLMDERDAWAGVRVWNPSNGGTAGTSIVASNPGDLPFQTVVLPPPPSPASRVHVALAASADGPGQGIAVLDYRAGPGSETPYTTIPSGGFLQVTPSSGNLAAPLGVIAMSATNFPLAARDDLLGYIVRNEPGTNDGTIVPFDPPDTLPGRRTRFLPAVVGVTSQFGQYRTELSLGWRSSSIYPPASLDFFATYREGNGSWTFPFSIGAGESLSMEDVGPWLAGNGVPVNPSSFVGTLTFSSDRPEGAADLLVTAVVLAPGPAGSGEYGVSVPVVNEVEWAADEAIVPGLRENNAFRSNLAVANPEPDGGPSVTLSVSLRQASDGAPIGTLTPVTLEPGKRFQFNRVLRIASYFGDGYAVVSRVAGTGRFVAYGVMNDNVTGDGTLFPMTRAE